MTQLQAGEMAPDFKSTTQDGEPLTLADLRGQRTILYFYPKDNTSGCTLEAKSLRDGKAELDGIPDHRRKPRQREVAPQFLRQARPEFHAALRHRPLGVRSLRRVGRKVDVRPQVHGCAAHDVRHRRRRPHREDFHQGGHQEPLPTDH